jgi:hypothetical protein
MDWQPIETAPKDGTAVLVFGERYSTPNGTPGIAVARWYEDGFPPQTWWGTAGNSLVVQCPSHWMPLPPPPDTA